MRARLVFTAALAALVLAGSSAAPSVENGEDQRGSASIAVEHSTNPPSANVPSADASTPSPKPILTGQKWADGKINAWVANPGIKSVKGFPYPYKLINCWDAPKPGHLRLFRDNSFEPNRDGMLQSFETAEDELRIMGLHHVREHRRRFTRIGNRHRDDRG